MKTLLIALLLTSATLAFAQPGTLDSKFGKQGILPLGDVAAEPMIIDRYGRLIVGAYDTTHPLAKTYIGAILARYTPDGVLDSQFGSYGKVRTYTNQEGLLTIRSLLLDSDGKIVIGGEGFAEQSEGLDFAISRYHSDGSLDLSFGDNGVTLTDFGRTGDLIRALTVQPDGKIVAGGATDSQGSFSPESDFALARYLPDGRLDPHFGDKGLVLADIGSDANQVHCLALQSDGKILAAGSATHQFGAIIRINHDGSYDYSFGDSGAVVTLCSEIYDMKLQPDGKIIIGGVVYDWANDHDRRYMCIARYHSNGQRDSSFGLYGNRFISFGNHWDDANAILLQQDGKIIIGGVARNAEGYLDFALARVLPDGEQDKQFGINGKVITPFDRNTDNLWSMQFTEDGSILACGGTHIVKYLSSFNAGSVRFSKTDNYLMVYPNPIRETATLEYTLAKDELLTIILYDLKGNVVSTFVNGEDARAGKHSQKITLPADLPSGAYLLVLSTPGGRSSIKIIKQ